jgi:hypothetical protein
MDFIHGVKLDDKYVVPPPPPIPHPTRGPAPAFLSRGPLLLFGVCVSIPITIASRPLSNERACREGIARMGLSTQKVAELLTTVFSKQIFLDGFVHCDPHPGTAPPS